MVLTRSQKKKAAREAARARRLKQSIQRQLTLSKRKTRLYHHTRRAHSRHPYSRAKLSKKYLLAGHEYIQHSINRTGKICGPDQIFHTRINSCVRYSMDQSFNYNQEYVQVLGPTRIQKLVGKANGMWPDKVIYLVGDRHTINTARCQYDLPVVTFKHLLHDTLVQASQNNVPVDILAEIPHASYHYLGDDSVVSMSHVIPSDNIKSPSLYLKDCDPGEIQHTMDLYDISFENICRYGKNITHHSIDPRSHAQDLQDLMQPVIQNLFEAESDEDFLNTFNSKVKPMFERVTKEIYETRNVNSQFQGIPPAFAKKLRDGVTTFANTNSIEVFLNSAYRKLSSGAVFDSEMFEDFRTILFTVILDMYLVGRLFRTFSHRKPIKNAVVLVGELHAHCMAYTLLQTGEFESVYNSMSPNQCVVIDTPRLPLPLEFNH